MIFFNIIIILFKSDLGQPIEGTRVSEVRYDIFLKTDLGQPIEGHDRTLGRAVVTLGTHGAVGRLGMVMVVVICYSSVLSYLGTANQLLKIHIFSLCCSILYFSSCIKYYMLLLRIY